MKKDAFLFMVLVLALAVTTARAQSGSINIDAPTTAAMTTSFAAEYVQESSVNESLQKIAKSYETAAVASSGIFASKYLDRKALTDLTPWKNPDENFYYKRAYKLVKNRIIPKVVSVTQMMVKDPSTALYWGSYLLETLEEVKSLCERFESIVTNSTLSFKDISFLKVADRLRSLFDLQHLGGVDWKALFEDLVSKVEGAFTKENIESDLDQLLNKGVGLATAGVNGVLEDLSRGSIFSDTFEGSFEKVTNIVDTYKDLYDEYVNHTGDKLRSLIGVPSMQGLLYGGLAEYNVTKWISDYATAADGTYYTQEVSLVRREWNGTETEFEYHPDINLGNVDGLACELSEWNLLSEEEKAAKLARAKEVVCNRTGWSQHRVDESNRAQRDMVYAIEFSPYVSDPFKWTEEGSVTYVLLSCHVVVTRSGFISTPIYTKVYDSYTMDWNAFMSEFNVKRDLYDLDGFGDEAVTDVSRFDSPHDDAAHGYGYEIVYGTKHYYTAPDELRLSGATMVTISAQCNDSTDMASGSFSYKCHDCGSTVDAHTRSCVMATTITDTGLETSDLQQKLTDAESALSRMISDLNALTTRQSQLRELIASATSTSEVEKYQSEYATNNTKITTLRTNMSNKEEEIRKLKEALNDAVESESVPTDDYRRLPHVMYEQLGYFNLNWKDEGHWEGNTFVRTAGMGDMGGDIVFTADVSIERGPKYFLGIKIHRAIVGVRWKLVGKFSDTTVLETIKYEKKSEDDKESRSQQMTERLSYWAQQYPHCDVTLDCTDQDPVVAESNDVYHLLWASDRLEIAQEIVGRLAHIYSGLVHLEKYLHYKHNVLAWLRDLMPVVNTEQGRRHAIIERSRRRWMHNAGSRYYELEAEDDNYGADSTEQATPKKEI